MIKQQLISIKNGQSQLSAGDQAKVFKLPVDANHVQNTAQVGDDLLVKLDDGRIITIKHYFRHGAHFNQLAFASDAQNLQTTEVEKGFIIEPTSFTATPHKTSPSIWMLGLGALLLGGVGIAATATGGSQPNPTPAAPAINTTANSNGTITVSGTGAAGSTVNLTYPDGTKASVTVPSSGIFSVTSPTPQTSGSVLASLTNPAGLTSPLTSVLVIDNTAPLAPIATTTANPNGTITVSGTAQPGSTIKTTFPDGTIGTTVVPASGQYTITSPTPQTSGPVSTTATDPAGNISTATTGTYTDITSPLAPTTTATTNPNGTLTVGGAAEPGSTVKVTFPDGTTGTAVVPANGHYAVTSITPQTSGAVEASVTDTAGNTSPVTASTFNDTTAPLAPTMTSTANPDGTLKVSGTAEPGSAVKVTFPDGTSVIVPVSPAGTYSATSTTPQGSGSASTMAKDAAGNISPAASITITDTTAPVAPTMTPASNPDGTVSVAGTAEPGSSVKVTFPDGTTGTAIVPSNGHYSVTSVTPQTTGSVHAIATDAAGNASLVASGTFTDSTAPLAPTVTSAANPNGTLTVSGTGEPGSTVKVTFPDGTTGTAIVPASGTYVITSETPQGSGVVSATATDVAGNASPPATATYADATAPLTPTAVTTANANGTLTVGGTAEPGTTVKVTFPDGTSTNVPVPANGIYSTTSPTPQSSGLVSVVDKDAAGNSSPAITNTYTDTTPPITPTSTTTANPDGTLKVTGTAEPGSTVKVTFPDGAVATVVAGANGAYTATSVAPQTSGIVAVMATDAAGNASSSAASTFTDNTAPLAPTITTTANANGTLTVAGAGEPGSTATVTFPDGTTAVVPVAANGTYSATSALAQPSGAVTVVDKDAAGNTSPVTTSTYADTMPPLAPTATPTANSNGTLTVAGTGEPGSTVKVTFPDGTSASVPVAADGTYTATSAGPQTSGSVTVTDKDPAGNISPTTTSAYIDSAAPLAPSAAPVGNPNGTLTVTGTAEPGSNVKVTFPDGTTATVPVAANGDYTATSATPQTSGIVTAVAKDAAGNISLPASSTYTDVTPPAAPTLVTTANPDGTLSATGTGEPGSTVNVTFPDGTSINATVAANGSYTTNSAAPQTSGTVTATDKDAAGNVSAPVTKTFNDTTPPPEPLPQTNVNPNGTLTVSGTGEPGSTMTVTFPDGTSVTVPVAANGTYATTSATPQTTGNVIVVDTDVAGNASPPGSMFYFDSTNPLAPTLGIIANPSGTLTASGTGEPGSSVKVTFPDGTTSTGPVAANGTYTVTSAAPQGSGIVTAVDKDAAGNVSPATTRVYTDTTAPAGPTLNTTVNPDGTLKVSGNGEPGSTVKVTFPDGTIANATVAANGTYSVTSITPQSSGPISAVDTDAAGNSSTPATSAYIDTTAPLAPTLIKTVNPNGTLTVSGAAEPGSTAIVTFPDGTTASVPVAPNGTYTATSVAPQTNGTISVVDKDAAGNTSPATAAIFADTTAPLAPTVTSAPNANGTLTVSGLGEPGSTVKVTFPDGTTASVSVAANGTYTATSTGPQTTGTISVVDKDAAGNTSPTTSTGYTDITAPLAPTLTATQNANGTLTASGTGEPGSIVKITFPDGTTANATVATNGVYSATSVAAQPSGTVTAVDKDTAGNSSVATTTAFIDPPPAAPTLVSTTDHTGPVQGPMGPSAFTDETHPTLAGTGIAGYAINVYNGATLVGTTTVDGTGHWTLSTSTLAEGAHTLNIKQLDLAGTASAVVSTNFTVDLTPPTVTAAIANGIDNVAPVAGNFANGGATNDTQPAFAGTLTSALSTGDHLRVSVTDGLGVVRVFDSAVDTAILTVTGSTFSLDLNSQPALANGTVSLSATVVDLAGNIGAATTFSYAQITTLTTAPTVDLATASDNGTSSLDNITSVSTPTISGTVATSVASVTIFVDSDSSGTFNSGDVVLASNVAVTGGTYSAMLAPMADGSYKVMAYATDVAGNIGPAGALDGNAAARLVINNSAPAAVLTTNQAFAELGYSTARIGDFNGDGFTDFIVSAPVNEDGHLGTNISKSYIVYGGANGLPSMNLSTMTASQGITISATSFHLPAAQPVYQNLTGSTVINIGDINGDGFADVAISSNMSNRTYVVFGRGGNTTAGIDLGTIDVSNNGTATTDGFVVSTSTSGGDWFGSGVTGGDINGDGFSDLIIGNSAPGVSTGGQVYVLNGHAGVGGSTAWQNLYGSIDGLHAINSNGTVGALLPTTAAGHAISSDTGTNFAASFLGDRMAVVGDVNGDGYVDYVVTMPLATIPDPNNAGATFTQGGKAFLMFGSAAGLGNLDLANLTSSQGIRLYGTEKGEWLGGSSYDGQASNAATANVSNLNAQFAVSHSVSNIGDINGDGIADFAIGSPDWGNGAVGDVGQGRTYVVYGKANGQTWTDFNLGNLNGTNGFILQKSSNGGSSVTSTSNTQLG